MALVTIGSLEGGRLVDPSLCGEREGLRPSPDLYCLDLVARPDLSSESGVLELGRAASPFDVAVTADGNQRYDATLQLADLPPPGTLGPYTRYVAWVAPPSLDPMVKLGPVENGRTALGEISFDKFLVFVTAEASAAVTERAGRMVLRGMSPSVRMQQHSMLMAARTPDSTSGQHLLAGHRGADSNAAAPRWTMPAMSGRASMMSMPGVDGLVPPARPLVVRLQKYAAALGPRADDDYFFPSPRGGQLHGSGVYRNYRDLLHRCHIGHGGRGEGPRRATRCPRRLRQGWREP